MLARPLPRGRAIIGSGAGVSVPLGHEGENITERDSVKRKISPGVNYCTGCKIVTRAMRMQPPPHFRRLSIPVCSWNKMLSICVDAAESFDGSGDRMF